MTTEKQKKYWDSMKGKQPWNKGVPMLEKSKKQLSNSKKGQVAWNKGKKCPYVSERNRLNNPQKKGELSGTWKGGCVEYRKRQALTRDDYTCQICGLREPEIMQVDHIRPKCLFPELVAEINNLMTLCPNCHAKKTIREKKQKYDKKHYE